MEKCFKENKGITLLAMAISIVIIIILSVIAINAAFGENGLVTSAKTAKEETEKERAREELGTVLADAFAEKIVNKEYNQNEFLDEFIKQRIEKVEILGDIVTVNGYSFEIDRSIPQIGRYLGKFEDLTFPTISTEVVLADDFKSANIAIKAKEEENGISKIEIIQAGEVLQTYTYDNVKEEITETYTVKNVGTYTVKVYSNTNMSQYVKVEGIVTTVDFTPNGSTEYKKEYTVKLSAEESMDKIKNIKYQWLQTVVEPSADSFQESCNNNDTIKKDGLTGTWYLWALVETESGKTNINRSEAFNFDNTGPVTTLTSTPVSANSFTLSATARDNETQVTSYKFYVNDELKETIETNAGTASYTVTDVDMGDTPCYVITTDALGNETKQTVTARTQMYTWERWSVNATTKYTLSIGNFYKQCSFKTYCNTIVCGFFNSNTGTFDSNYNRDVRYHTSGWLNFAGSVYYSCAYCTTGVSSCEKMTYTNLYRPNIKSNTTYSKGPTKYSDTTSTSSSTYPTNGQSGSYWYVYKGIQ